MLNAVAAPFAEWFEEHTSFGTTVRVWGEGDEYSAVFETEAGYTILYDPTRKAYFYAVQEADGSLAMSDLELGASGAADAIAVRAQPHLRDLSGKAREARADRIRRDETESARAARWATLKQNNLAWRQAKEKGLLMAPPTRPTIGTVKGLTVLIDFPIADSSATTWSSVHPNVTVAELDELLNGDACTLYGNASSVRSYYLDASNGRLDYSMEVIGPIVAPQPRSHYDDTSRDNGECARELIGDIFNIIKNDPDCSTKYLPILQSLSTLNGTVRSLNFWFAGESATKWSYGLWAHKWSVGSTIADTYKFQDASGATVKFGNYQITPILSSPGIYTFCHENGHMLCGFPDLYCYNGPDNLGVGYFSLMFGSSDKANPPYFDPYLRAAAGWVEPQLLPSTGGVLTVRANHADVWKYANPSNPEEYYLVENRQQTGRDASIRASGILIWRCNEAGNNQQTNALFGFSSSVHRLANELSLEQADGAYDIELAKNYGDKWDSWYAGNGYSKGVFNDSSVPTAQWSDTSASGLSLGNFSSNGETMTFTAQPYTPASETIPLATAVDNDKLEFITEGGARWTGQTAKAYYGGSAAKSGAIGNNRGTWFKTTVEGPGEISFAWAVSSELNYDFLEFSIDGVQKDRISGTSGTWSTKTYEVEAGEHVFVWSYVKDSSTAKGDDAGYVDKIVWTPIGGSRVTVGGTTYDTLAEAIVHANSRTPLVFESTPTIDPAARTITSAMGETVKVADIYDLGIEDKTVTLTLIASIRKPSVQPFTRVTRRAGQTTEVLVPAFTEDADGAGRPALSVLTRPNFYYALGSVADNGDVTEISDWVAGDGTPQQLIARQPSGSSLGRDHYTVLVSEVAP